jgi:hypothetical protein
MFRRSLSLALAVMLLPSGITPLFAAPQPRKPAKAPRRELRSPSVASVKARRSSCTTEPKSKARFLRSARRALPSERKRAVQPGRLLIAKSETSRARDFPPAPRSESVWPLPWV